MKLTTESGGDTPDPTPEAIEEALAELDRENGFLILGREEEFGDQGRGRQDQAEGFHGRQGLECEDRHGRLQG